MKNTVKLLNSDIIYVEKVGPQTEKSMLKLFAEVNDLALSLRSQDKAVIVLSNATHEGRMDDKAREIAGRIGTNLDYDKSAAYGNSPYLFEMRKHMIIETKLSKKVRDFETQEQAIAWLLEKV